MNHKKSLLFEQMISLEHLVICWKQFRKGKRKRIDVQVFERNLEDQIFDLHKALQTQTYHHQSYWQFYVFDPKERYISKAHIRDRLVHHMIYNILNAIYEPRFIFHSFSCRPNKGTHAGIKQLQRMLREVSCNDARPCYALKMDIRRFFDTVSHPILKSLLSRRIKDSNVLNVIEIIIDSFKVSSNDSGNRGLPLGNVTSQIFANIYLHELDHFIKHRLKEPFYLRYCDDSVLISQDLSHLKKLIPQISLFLKETLNLKLHPRKIILRKWSEGIDFLGYVSFPQYSLMRSSTRRRMCHRLENAYQAYLIDKIDEVSMDQRLQSYLGMLTHANQFNLSQALKNGYWCRAKEERILSQVSHEL
jgi:RNA-directed DNA polymerase